MARNESAIKRLSAALRSDYPLLDIVGMVAAMTEGDPEGTE